MKNKCTLESWKKLQIFFSKLDIWLMGSRNKPNERITKKFSPPDENFLRTQYQSHFWLIIWISWNGRIGFQLPSRDNEKTSDFFLQNLIKKWKFTWNTWNPIGRKPSIWIFRKNPNSIARKYLQFFFLAFRFIRYI